MDSPKAIANKGYETFGEHFFNAGKANATKLHKLAMFVATFGEHFMKKGESNAISVFEKLGVSPEKNAEAKAMLAALLNK